MAFTRSLMLAALIGVSFLSVTGVSNAETKDMRATVDKLNQNFMAALERGDVAGVASIYAKDATIFPPGLPPIVGNVAIGEFWKKMVASGVKRVVPQTTELHPAGDTLIEYGTFDAFRDTTTPPIKGRYCVVWKKEGGEWKVFRDLWNTEAAPAPKATAPAH